MAKVTRNSIQKQKIHKIITDMYLEGHSFQDIANFLNEAGMYLSGTNKVSSRKIRNIVVKQQEQWAEEQESNRDEMLLRQQMEIRHIKQKLHSDGDYKTLIRYIEHEARIQGLDKKTIEHEHSGEINITVEQRISALQLARDQEAEIAGLLEDDPVVDGVVVSYGEEIEHE